MGDKNSANQDPQAPVVNDSDTDPKVQIQKQISQQDASNEPKVEKVYAEEQILGLLEKTRADEKSKVFSKLEALKASNAEYQKKLDELEAMKKEVEKDRDALREGRSSEYKSVNEELVQLREQNEKLQKAFEASVEASAVKIREQELKAYRAEKLRQAGLSLAELVSGNSEDEIDKSIALAQKREKEIEDRLRERIQKDLASDLPTPIITDGSQGRGPTPVISPQNRQAVAQLKGAEYARRRQELLQEAKQKAGLA
jgi:hypothetical protein